MEEALARQQAWQRARRVLAVRLDTVGDLLMTTPALASLRAALPGAHITLLCSRAGAALVPHLDMVDAAIEADVPWVRHPGVADQAAQPGLAEQALLERLRAERFDAAILFTSSTQSALPAAALMRLAGIPRTLAHCRENPYALLSDWVPETDRVCGQMRHEVRRQLDLLLQIAVPPSTERLRFRLREQDRAQAADRLRHAGRVPGRPYVLLHPGATAASRRWPAESFGLVARQLATRTDHQVVLCGAALDAPWVLAAAAVAGEGCTAIPDIGTLGELGALIDGAALLIGNNSAPSHLAAALGTPVVCLYALTNPQHMPWRAASAVLCHDVPCRWCLKSVCPQADHGCLRHIPPERVVQAALRLLQWPDRSAA